MKFILNKTSGINGIEKVSLEKIIRTFSVPKNIEYVDYHDIKNYQSLDNFYHRFLTYDEKSKILNSVKENKQVFATRDIIVYF